MTFENGIEQFVFQFHIFIPCELGLVREVCLACGAAASFLILVVFQ